MARRVREAGMTPRLAVAVIAALLATARGEPGDFSGKWETLTNCRLLKNDWNDGDSFHISHNGREYIFRLYFVDTPETHDVSPHKSRTTEQAKYWKIRKKELYELADAAAQFSAAKLGAGPFTVRTKWEDAKGESKLPRNFAVIETAGGDLAELLVANGLARIYGHHIDHPRGISWEKYSNRLHRLEEEAKAKKLGGWAAAAGQPASNAAAVSRAPPESGGDKENLPSNGVRDLPAY